MDVSRAFVDPDDDALTYTVSSSAPRVVAASAAGARVTLTAVGEGRQRPGAGQPRVYRSRTTCGSFRHPPVFQSRVPETGRIRSEKAVPPNQVGAGGE